MPSPLRLALAPRWSVAVWQVEAGGLALVELERDGAVVEVVTEPLDVLAWLEWLAAWASAERPRRGRREGGRGRGRR